MALSLLHGPQTAALPQSPRPSNVLMVSVPSLPLPFLIFLTGLQPSKGVPLTASRLHPKSPRPDHEATQPSQPPNQGH